MWGQSTYTCGGETLDHGAYTRWYEVRFKPVGGNPQPPEISLAQNSVTLSPTEGYIIPYGAIDIAVQNAGDGTLPDLSASPDVEWLSAAVSGSGNTHTVTVKLSKAGLSAGEYTGTVVVSGPDLTSKDITVTCTVAPIGTVPQTRMLSPAKGSLLRETLTYSLEGEGENLIWYYDANSDKKGKIKIGEGGTVDFVLPDGITGPRTITLFLEGENGSVERQFDVGIPLITVSSPNGGEALTAGETATIEWIADTSIITDVDILYTTNRGIDWAKINGSSSVTLDSPEWGSYSWDIPEHLNSQECLIRVEKYEPSSSAEMDVSNAVFEIQTPVRAITQNSHPPRMTSSRAGLNKLQSGQAYSVRGRKINLAPGIIDRMPRGVMIVKTERGLQRKVLRAD